MTRNSVTCSRATRRAVLKVALGAALELPLIDLLRAKASDPSQTRPQENDYFVFAFGDRTGQVMAPEDVPLGGPQVFAYPMDPATGRVRNGSRLNQVILVHLDPEEISENIRTHSAEGIVAYSAVCTHTGCDISEWNAETRNFVCPCHFSEFDPRQGARVLNGPAPRRLALLPVKVEDGVLMAAAGFSGRVGFKKK